MTNYFLSGFPKNRLRRLRFSANVRNLVRETKLLPNDLIFPLFIKEMDGEKRPIESMPGHYQLSIKDLAKEIKEITSLGINGVILFGIPERKDSSGNEGIRDNGIIQNAIKEIKNITDKLTVISDICFCEYMDHGHCGIVSKINNKLDLDNDKTLELIQQQSVSHAHAGADILAPSGMVDGMVQSIRSALDNSRFEHVPIMSYSVKYSSSLYAPFRDAAEGAPQFGSRKSYQMDPSNGYEALKECKLDIMEGADILLVKPAMTYLDIIYRVKEYFKDIPLGAYHVSGEYSMVKAAAKKQWLNEEEVFVEILTGIKRAGADFIISYASKEVIKYLNNI